MITLVLGGTRSGKSQVAEAVLEAHPGPLAYLATGTPTDEHMAERIEIHQRRRGDRVRTVEVGLDLGDALRSTDAPAVLVDSLGSWVARHPELDPDVDDLIDALDQRRSAGAFTVVVSEEVGMAVHPTSEVGRRYVDVLGSLNTRAASVADDALLVVAGRVLRLETFR